MSSASRSASADGDATVVLHSSLTGIVMAFAGAILLTALAVASLLVGGWTVVTSFLTIASIAAVAVTLLDMPISSEFDSAGVTRRALLRHHRLAWDDVDRLVRMRKGVLRSSKVAPTGGLAAERGRRTFHLVDRMEGFVEFGRLRAVLGEQGERLGINRVGSPPLDRTPTWLNRRSAWHPSAESTPDSPRDR